MAKRKFMFLYLNTGGGHLAPAKVFKSYIEQQYPDASVEIVNGFADNYYLGKFCFEQSYHKMSTVLTGLWHLIYDFGQHRSFQTISQKLMRPNVPVYLAKLIEEKEITDIVSFHFALTPSAYSAIRKTGRKVNLSAIVTDPFTAHSAWFWQKGVRTYVFSQEVKDFAVNKCGYNPDDIKIMPFLINKKFLTPTTKDDVNALRDKYGIPRDKRVVLIAGGGEGLPGALHIINEFILKKVDFSMVVVCGRGKKTKMSLELLKKVNPHLNLFIFGFVNFMDELVKLSDCAIIKCGTSTVLEMIAAEKPVILSTFIHGQELGNERFVVNNKVGYFIQKPKAITNKIAQIFADDKIYDELRKNIKKLNLNADCTEFVKENFAE